MGKYLQMAMEAEAREESTVQKRFLVQELPMDAETDSNCTYNRYCTKENEDTPRLSIAGPEEWREGFNRLITSPAPMGITVARWRQFIQDAEHFMTDWAEKADALGWTAVDVFGLHPEAPAHRMDAAGLIWLLSGHRVAALSENEAVIRISDSRRQTFHRRARGGVPAWELTENGKERTR